MAEPRAGVVWAVCCLTVALAAAVGQEEPAPAEQLGLGSEAPGAGSAPAQRYRSPYAAYDAGAYDQALEGFVDQQVERPDDPALALNVGATHYEMRNYADAEAAFGRAALSGEPDLRKDALYNLGNTAYRQGRLEEAVAAYQAALELDPEDQDAKFNLEFVRDEIRRRHEEAQQRQQQQGQDSQQDDQGQSSSEGEPPPDSGEGESNDPSQSGAEEDPAQDGDQDGLSDQVERQGENPTDPENPDTDGDGLEDGQEDVNRNGRVDPGETDPNRADSDGDGVPDGAEAPAAQQPPTQDGASEAQAREAGEMTPEEAERYLQALAEGRPERPARPGRRGRPEKDW